VRDEVLNLGINPVWISVNNLNGLVGNEATEEWRIAQPATWDEYVSILLEISSGEVISSSGNGGAVVVDGLNLLSSLALPPKPTQADWGDMGAKVRDSLLGLRSRFEHLYVILDVLDNDEGKKQLAINRDLYNKIVSLFDRKWYCYTVPEEAKGKRRSPVSSSDEWGNVAPFTPD